MCIRDRPPPDRGHTQGTSGKTDGSCASTVVRFGGTARSSARTVGSTTAANSGRIAVNFVKIAATFARIVATCVKTAGTERANRSGRSNRRGRSNRSTCGERFGRLEISIPQIEYRLFDESVQRKCCEGRYREVPRQERQPSAHE